MLNISISIGDVESELITDQNLSFDAIESLLNRAVAATLQCYLSLPTGGSSCELRTDEEEDDDEEAE